MYEETSLLGFKFWCPSLSALKPYASTKLFYLFVLQGVLDGKYDDLSEQSFYMVGGIEEVIAKAEKIAKESAA